MYSLLKVYKFVVTLGQRFVKNACFTAIRTWPSVGLNFECRKCSKEIYYDAIPQQFVMYAGCYKIDCKIVVKFFKLSSHLTCTNNVPVYSCRITMFPCKADCHAGGTTQFRAHWRVYDYFCSAQVCRPCAR